MLYKVSVGAAAILVPIVSFSPFIFILILGVRLVVWETREPTAG